MKRVLSLIAVVVFAGVAKAQMNMPGMPGMGGPAAPKPGASTTEYCTDDSRQVCAHLHFHSNVDTRTEGHFIVHVEVPGDQAIQDFRADLWMDMGNGHGHGSAPLDIQNAGEVNHFDVSNAWFVMAGTWLVRLDFSLQGRGYHIEIPVTAAP